MAHSIFAFSLTTSVVLEKGQTVFSESGDLIGRILAVHKLPEEKTLYSYDYDVESTPDTYAKLKSGELKIYRIDKYSVTSCSICYVRK